jgi:sulfofructose kinase
MSCRGLNANPDPQGPWPELQMLIHSRFSVDVLCVGHASYDLIMTVDRHPGPDEKCSATSLVESGGGPAANAAVTVARLGGSAAFAGYLGEDLHGCEHLKELKREGVRTDLIVRGKHPTPLSFILVKPNGNRTVVNSKTGTPPLHVDQIDFACCAPTTILFDGHEPTISKPLAEAARNRGVITVLDAGSVHRGTLELLPLVDYLVASERFALDFTREQDPERAFRALKDEVRSAVVTFGERGLKWKDGRTEGSLPAFSVEAVDTTGAGDTFHGAFALEIARGTGFVGALIFASAAAAMSCKSLGARLSIPTREEVLGLLRQQKNSPVLAEKL